MEFIALIAFAVVAVVVAFGLYVNRKNIELRDNIAEEFQKFVDKSEESIARRILKIKADVESKL